MSGAPGELNDAGDRSAAVRAHAVTPASESPVRPSRARGVRHYVALGASGAVLLIVVALAMIVIVIPRVTDSVPLTVLTSSMEPSLPPGTLIVVRPVDTAELAIGDVATYQITSGRPEVITHRIVAISASSVGRSFQFKGDNNDDPDPDRVVADQIQGRVWYSVPLVGFVNTAMGGQNRSWIIPAGAILLLGYAGWMITSGSIAAARNRGGSVRRGRRARR